MFIIEADTPDELRSKLIKVLESNAERCDRNAGAHTGKMNAHFKSQAIAFRMMATDLKATEIRPKSYDPFAEAIQKRREELKSEKS
jgi:hypothetical protein